MIRNILLACGLTFMCSTYAFDNNAINHLKQTPMTQNKNTSTIYDYKVQDINGNTFDFAQLKGKKILIVNTASECGLTPQFEQLESLYKEFGPNDFVIVGFPANNFAGQEPGSDQEIAAFCQSNYGVSFPMMSKISVKGDDMADIYAFLTQEKLNNLQDSQVEWNFQKYLINPDGQLHKVISPRTLPTDKEIKDWIKSK